MLMFQILHEKSPPCNNIKQNIHQLSQNTHTSNAIIHTHTHIYSKWITYRLFSELRRY